MEETQIRMAVAEDAADMLRVDQALSVSLGIGAADSTVAAG